jgi:hypothetical protein
MELGKKKDGKKGGKGGGSCRWIWINPMFGFVFMILLLLLILSPVCFAQDDISSGDIIGNGRYLGAKTVDGQAIVPVLGVNASGNTEVNSLSGKAAVLAVAKTPVVSCTGTACTFAQSIDLAAGKGVRPAINSVTFKATPTPSVDLLVVGYNVPAGTPTASTVARLPATPTPGDVVEFYNSAAATLKIQAGGAATINGAGTNGTIAVATLVSVTCKASGTANWDCRLNVNPTPAA